MNKLNEEQNTPMIKMFNSPMFGEINSNIEKLELELYRNKIIRNELFFNALEEEGVDFNDLVFLKEKFPEMYNAYKDSVKCSLYYRYLKGEITLTEYNSFIFHEWAKDLCTTSSLCFKNHHSIKVYTYVVQDESCNFKIGKSINPYERFESLKRNTGSVADNVIMPILVIDGDFEKYLHNSLKDKNIKGEWFDCTFEDIWVYIRTFNSKITFMNNQNANKIYNTLKNNDLI